MQEFTAGDGRYQVTLKLEETGKGLVGFLYGGDLPHVGGVVLANPRESLTGEGQSCDVWTLHLPGHLDHVVAESMAKKLCTAFQVPLSLTAGIHLDDATPEELDILTKNCEALTTQALSLSVILRAARSADSKEPRG